MQLNCMLQKINISSVITVFAVATVCVALYYLDLVYSLLVLVLSL